MIQMSTGLLNFPLARETVILTAREYNELKDRVKNLELEKHAHMVVAHQRSDRIKELCSEREAMGARSLQWEQDLAAEKTHCEGWYQTARERARIIDSLKTRIEQLEQWLLGEQKATRAVEQTVRDREAKIKQLGSAPAGWEGAAHFWESTAIGYQGERDELQAANAKQGEKISQLEETIERLQQEVARRDEVIRLVALTHDLQREKEAFHRVADAVRKVFQMWFGTMVEARSHFLHDLSDAFESLDAPQKEAAA